MVNGFVMDDERPKDPGWDYFEGLLFEFAITPWRALYGLHVRL